MPISSNMEIVADSQLLKVAGHSIPYLLCGDEQDIWFQAKPLAELLEYSDTAGYVRDHVRLPHRQPFSSLKDVYGHTKVISGGVGPGPTPSIQPATVYVDEPGMWTLLMQSTRPEAEAIQEWVTATVLPTIRKLGHYSVHPQVVQMTSEERSLGIAKARQQLGRGTIEMYDMMVANGMANDYDRLLMADIARNVMMPLSTLPAIKAGPEGSAVRMLAPISDIVRDVTGRAGTKKEIMRLGREVAAEYRELHNGEDPPEVERFVDGTTRMVKAYSPSADAWIRDFVATRLS